MLQANARLHPHEPAVVIPGAVVSFRDFCQHIERVTRHLHAFALPEGARVVINVNGGYFSRLVHIALSRLGMVSVVTTMHDLVKPAAVITDRPGTSGPFREIAVQASWTSAAADALPRFEEPRHPADALCAIVLSSGTTGTPKLAPFSYAQLNERIRATIIAYRLTPSSRMIATVGMSTVGGLVLPLASWCAGGSAVMSTAQGAGHLQYRPTVMFVSTAQLAEIVRGMSPERTPLDPPEVYVAGSVLPRHLNINARLRLGASVIMVYGSTEVGTITLAPAGHTDRRPDLTGYVLPHADVEIVDAQGSPVAQGTVGEVRIRAAGQCELYLDDPRTSATAFRDGWFHPGDLGRLGPKGELFIVGRVNELMNFNGVKLSPQFVEEKLGEVAGVSDLAVFSVPDARGERPCIAVVPSSGNFSEAELAARFQKTFPGLPKVSILHVAGIPRNDMGKVMRSQLVLGASSSTGEPPPTVH